MKKLAAIAFIAVGITSFMASSCGKGSSGGSAPVAEDNLIITTTPANGSVLAATVATTFNVSVKIDSKMPPQGVKIEVSAAPEAGGAAFYTATPVTTSNATTSFTITNTPAQVSCITTVKVTSVSKATNTVTSSYRYSRKS